MRAGFRPGMAGLVLLLASLAAPAWAQSIESALSPGPLIKGHIEAEPECSKCHVRFDRAGQDRLCMACHKDIGVDMRYKTGLHGRHRPATCRSCHTDHRGRDMKIAEFDRKTFDHRQTDYVLKGKHVGLECKGCHAIGKKFSQAPHDCLSCHKKDDKHKGTLGNACADCHVEQDWKETKFDHDKTKYPLTGRHVDVKCDACHKSKIYNEAPSTCIGCHKKDDKHKARYGEKCESCHTTKNWTGITFRHDSDTKYTLRGKHREIKCDACHGPTYVYREKPGNQCNDCHKKDDKHKGTLGVECQACHNEAKWTESGKFDHDKSNFPLRGGHIKPACKDCHSSALYKDAPSDCYACHKKDDKHEGNLGTACADCHSDADWKARRFDHARTKFQLRQGHAVPPLKCEACHANLKSYGKTALECYACHKKDDKHETQLGNRCETCHRERNWRETRFDHAKARFVLAGAHVKVECKGCHQSPRYRDAPRDCIGCHLKQDKHKARFGEKCETCHNQRDWRLWNYHHERQANYKLESGHLNVACEACHAQPAPRDKLAAPVGRDCLSCHRRDDIHDGAFGPRCENCHSATRWKQVTNRQRVSALPPAYRTGQARQPSGSST